MDTTAADPVVGTLLDGRYRVGARIARGGMATVYAAVDVRLDRRVAVKVLHAGYADDPDFATRFQREARSAARLAHPNVVDVFDQGEDHGTLFLAMEYVPGRTLRDIVREQAPLAPARALAMLEPVLSALAAAHEAGFVHRDVKPENVLIADDGRVKVADFGLARAVSGDTAQTAATSGVLIGTVSYLAPELVVDGTADSRTDVYACGVLLYELLTGRKPHQGDSPIQVAYKHVHEDVPPPSALQPEIPPYVDALVGRATARRREARFADAKVLLRQLRRVRQALEAGVTDDPDLTADLTPTGPVELDDLQAASGEPLVESVDELAAPFLGADGREHTLQVRGRREDAARGPRRRRGVVAFLLVLAVAGAAAAGGWYYGVGRYTETPALAGLTLPQAQQALTDRGLEYTTSRSFSETVESGRVIATDPGAGERVLDGGIVEVVVSQGKERYDMPRVAGLTEQQAARQLERRNLAVGDVRRRFSERVGEGVVISASERVGTPLRRDTEVDLVVSKGRRPIEVPDVVGREVADARAQLDDLGLVPEVTEEYDNDRPAGEVIAQDPTDGTLHRGDAVALIVSKGPELLDVPSVFAQDRPSAEQTLRDAGFEVEVRTAPGYAGLNRVVSQRPNALSRAPRGSTVVIYLY